MIRVWSDTINAGLLDRHGPRGAAFSYDPAATRDGAVSMTMPVRLASWDQAWGLHPIFEMNLPEGALRETLRRAFARAVGTFDDLDLLSVVGRSQIGRLRYTAPDSELDEEVPFQSVDEILSHRRDGDLFQFLMDRFARYSGISGVQPKVMIRDEANAQSLADAGQRRAPCVKGATHIVKFCNPSEYPHLAANEFFCLLAEEHAGLAVPRRRLSDDGTALVIDRFDLRPDGTYRGIEITTPVYLPKDMMALTLDGKPFWPSLKQLIKLGTTRCLLSLSEAKAALDRVAGGVTDALAEMLQYAHANPAFAEVAAAMEAQWREGLRQSLDR